MVIRLKSSRHALKGCSPADQLAAFLVYFLSVTKNKGLAVLPVLLFLGSFSSSIDYQKN